MKHWFILTFLATAWAKTCQDLLGAYETVDCCNATVFDTNDHCSMLRQVYQSNNCCQKPDNEWSDCSYSGLPAATMVIAECGDTLPSTPIVTAHDCPFSGPAVHDAGYSTSNTIFFEKWIADGITGDESPMFVRHCQCPDSSDGRWIDGVCQDRQSDLGGWCNDNDECLSNLFCNEDNNDVYNGVCEACYYPGDFEEKDTPICGRYVSECCAAGLSATATNCECADEASTPPTLPTTSTPPLCECVKDREAVEYGWYDYDLDGPRGHYYDGYHMELMDNCTLWDTEATCDADGDSAICDWVCQPTCDNIDVGGPSCWMMDHDDPDLITNWQDEPNCCCGGNVGDASDSILCVEGIHTHCTLGTIEHEIGRCM